MSDNSKTFWMEEINNCSNRQERWIYEAKDAIRIYRGLNLRDAALGKGDFPFKDMDNVRYNIFHSNTQLLLSSLFTTFPKPFISKRFSQQNDILSDTVSEVSERAVSYFADCNDFKYKVKQSILDYLMVGRGVSWIKYEPQINDESIGYQNIDIDYVYWADFRHSWARKWEDVWWVSRRYYLNKKDLTDKFDDKIANDIELKFETSNVKGDKGFVESDDKGDKKAKFAEVWEIWNRDTEQRIFTCDSYKKDKPLAIDKVPLKLENFYPCPKPLFSIFTNDEVVPIPELRIYFKQAMELNRLAERITYLTDSLYWCGITDGKHGEVAKNLSNLRDNQWLAVDIGGEIREKGGLAGLFLPMPLTDRVNTINTLYEKIEAIKQEIYEITGISDLMRSLSAQPQTATEAKIKGTFGSLRLVRRQEDIQNFIKDTIKIVAEIICEHFTPENLQTITGMQLPTMQQKEIIAQKFAQKQVTKEEDEFAKKPTWEQVVQIMRNQKLRDYKIDIETTSTAFDDVQQDKAEKNEFTAQMNSLMQAAMPMIQQVPESIDFVKELVMFNLSSYKTSRNMTQNIEGIFDTIKDKLLSKPQGQEQAGDVAKTQAQAQIAQMRTQADLQKAQMQLQAKASSDAQKNQIETQKLALEQQKFAGQQSIDTQDLERKQEKDLADVEIAQETVSIKQQEANRKDSELEIQARLKAEELAAQKAGQAVDINTNIAGDVGTLE